MKKRRNEAIQKGQEWMEKSVNPSHDYEHAESVAFHALKVLESLKQSGWEKSFEIDKDLVLITAWWHDCYKALHSKNKIYVEIFEGVSSAKIAKKELGDLLSEKELKEGLGAIRWHNIFFIFPFLGRRLPLLTRILVEADIVDSHDFRKRLNSDFQDKSLMYTFLESTFKPILSFFESIYIKSPYAKIKIKNFKKGKNEFKTKYRAKESGRA